MIQNLVNLLRKYWVALVIILVPIPCIFWLPSGSSIMHGLFYPWPEQAPALFNLAYQYLYAWIFGGMGLPNSEPSGFLYYFLTAIFLKIGGSPHVGQILLLYFGYVGIIGGMYFLARTLKIGKKGSLIAGLFYLFSPFVFTGMPIESLNFRQIPYHIATPILLAFFVRALKTKSFLIESACFGIIGLLASAGYSSLQYFFLHLMILSIYALYSIFQAVKEVKALKTTLFRLAVLFLILFSINFYWLFPIFSNIQGAYNQRSEPGFSINHDIDMVKVTSAKIIDALIMIPYGAQKYISPWMMYYYQPLVMIVLFLFLSIVPIPLFYKEIRSKAIFPMLWFIIALFFVSGVKGPFLAIGNFVFNIHPYFTRLFRNVTYFELIVVPALALLIGLAIDYLLSKLKNYRFQILGIVTIFVFLGLIGWPFISGSSLDFDKEKSGQCNALPDYFNETADFLRSKSEHNRLNSIPEFTYQDSFVSYKWKNIYHGAPMLGLLTGKPFYRPLYPELVGKVDEKLATVLHPEQNIISNDEFNFISSIANTRYLTFHRDTAWLFVHNLDPVRFPLKNGDGIEQFLLANDAIEKIKTTGQIDIYRINDDYFLPQFYTPRKIFVLKNDLSDFSSIFSSKDFDIRSTIFSEKQYQDNEPTRNFIDGYKIGDLPILEFRKISPVKYKVVVHSAISSFPLIDSESFHPGWKVFLSELEMDSNLRKDFGVNDYAIADNNKYEQASLDELREYIDNDWISNLNSDEISFVSKNFNGTIQNDNLSNGRFYETWFEKPIIDENRHLVANIYANSWIVNPAEICEGNVKCYKNQDGRYDFELIVEYRPQRLFFIGFVVSGLVFFACLMSFLFVLYRQSQKKI